MDYSDEYVSELEKDIRDLKRQIDELQNDNNRLEGRLNNCEQTLIRR
jgi:chaperonin cofactor prefoldin